MRKSICAALAFVALLSVSEVYRKLLGQAATPFTQKCEMPGVLKCKGFDDSSGLRYNWPSPAISSANAWAGDTCDKALGGTHSNYYFTPQAEPYANVRAAVQN